MGRKGGAEILIKALEAQVESWPNTVVIKVDTKAAFQSLHRPIAFAEVEKEDADLATVLRTWYAKPTEYLWRNAAGKFEKNP